MDAALWANLLTSNAATPHPMSGEQACFPAALTWCSVSTRRYLGLGDIQGSGEPPPRRGSGLCTAFLADSSHQIPPRSGSASITA
jgi:hypothetical protein